MNENAKQWVAALRSGKYKQAKHYLRDGMGGYCCLGVACELYREVTGKGEWNDDEEARFIVDSYMSIMHLPDPVRDWLGLGDTAGVYRRSALTDQNDVGKTFEEIADIIESEPEGLFA